jgi:hypothetical protein
VVDDILEKIRIGSAQLRQQKVENREVAVVDISNQYNCRRKTQETLSERRQSQGTRHSSSPRCRYLRRDDRGHVTGAHTISRDSNVDHGMVRC